MKRRYAVWVIDMGAPRRTHCVGKHRTKGAAIEQRNCLAGEPGGWLQYEVRDRLTGTQVRAPEARGAA